MVLGSYTVLEIQYSQNTHIEGGGVRCLPTDFCGSVYGLCGLTMFCAVLPTIFAVFFHILH